MICKLLYKYQILNLYYLIQTLHILIVAIVITIMNIAHKNMAIDAILKRLLNYLNTSNEENLKIEVKKENNLILLIINNIKVFETQFNYDFVKKDIYYLETIISELVQDYYKFDLSKVDIVVYE